MMSSDTSSLLVIVPAYNEAGAVDGVVESVRGVLPGVRIIVIDDGSWDDTARVAEQGGADVFRLPHHLGLGGAVQTGYRYAFEHGYQRVVRVDGDGQHDPADIKKLLKAMDEGDYDMVSDSRFLVPNGYPTANDAALRQLDLLVDSVADSGKTHDRSDLRVRGSQPQSLGSIQRQFPARVPGNRGSRGAEAQSAAVQRSADQDVSEAQRTIDDQ